jgi:predicted esterase
MMRAVAILLGVATLVATAPAEAACAPPLLEAHPVVTSASLPPGETRLSEGAVAYRPKSAPAGPLPLLVLLHGTGDQGAHFLKIMEPLAERRGLLMVAPRAKSGVWDLMENLAAHQDPWSGSDSCRIDRALADLFARTAVDSKRVVLLGFSDGASYALSLGTANPQLFSAVISLSPGYFVPPKHLYRPQKVFIAHGRKDSVLSFANSHDVLAGILGKAGVDLRFRAFDGDHQISRSALNEALDFALGLQPYPTPPTSPPR